MIHTYIKGFSSEGNGGNRRAHSEPPRPRKAARDTAISHQKAMICTVHGPHVICAPNFRAQTIKPGLKVLPPTRIILGTSFGGVELILAVTKLHGRAKQEAAQKNACIIISEVCIV